MYVEGDLPVLTYGNNCNSNNNGWSDWSWIIGLALVGGLFGNGGFGFGNGFGARNGFGCYSTPATQADLANGFAQNTIQRGIDDIILGQAQAINYNNQGFSGLNTALTSGFAGVDNAICTLGYQNQAGFNGVDRAICTLGYQNQAGVNAIQNQIASCCCDLKTMNLENRYLNEKQTCDIVSAINAGNQRLVDIYTADKMDALRAENTALKGQISNDKQTASIVSQLRDPGCPVASYVVPNPNCCYNPFGFGFGGYGYNNGNCCGASVQ